MSGNMKIVDKKTRQIQIITTMLATPGVSLAEAARENRVSPSTAHDWYSRDSAFRELLAQKMDELYSAAGDELKSYYVKHMKKAMTTMAENLDDHSGHVRFLTSSYMLDKAERFVAPGAADTNINVEIQIQDLAAKMKADPPKQVNQHNVIEHDPDDLAGALALALASEE
ncbi:MAG: hypothetical protein ACR2JC_11325 [Chloroflexota bacterium]|nr:MAG: hypothetical protein DLM70_01455 [Chloroflexota bacterium]